VQTVVSRDWAACLVSVVGRLSGAVPGLVVGGCHGLVLRGIAPDPPTSPLLRHSVARVVMRPGPSNLNAEPEAVFEREAVSLTLLDLLSTAAGVLADRGPNRCEDPDPLVLLRENRRPELELPVVAEVRPPELVVAASPVLGRRTTPRWPVSLAPRLPLRPALLDNS